MTHAYLAIKSLDSPITLIKGHQYIMGEKDAEEIGMEELIKKKVVKELTAEEALSIYKKTQ